MHTTEGKTCTFIHHGDHKGPVTVLVPRAQTKPVAFDNDRLEVEIDADDLLLFAAEAIRSKKISELESATTEELLGL